MLIKKTEIINITQLYKQNRITSMIIAASTPRLFTPEKTNRVPFNSASTVHFPSGSLLATQLCVVRE